MMKSLIASELDDIFDDEDIIYIETELDGIQRHPSNKGSVIIDMGKKIFVPDARYRKKRVSINSGNDAWYRYEFNPTRPYIEQLYNETHNLHSATQINNKVLEFNKNHYSISCFDICNSINVPKVGKCVIPTYEQMILIGEYKDELDRLDISIRTDKTKPFGPFNRNNNSNKSFNYWMETCNWCTFITSTIIKGHYYNNNYALNIKTIEFNDTYRSYYDYSRSLVNENYSLIPIIEL